MRHIFYDSLKRFFVVFVATLALIAPTFAANLPAGYTELEYIESTGTQYIDTGIKGNMGVKADIDFSVSNIQSTNFILASRKVANSDTRFYACTFYYSGEGQFDIALGKDSYTPGVVANQRYNYVMDTSVSPATLVVDGNITIQNANSYNTDLNMYLFANNLAGTASFGGATPIRIYYAKIYQNNTLVRDFVPAQTTINGEKVNGMYDTVGNQFYRSAASGTNFTAGPAKCRNLLNPDNFLEIINDVYPNFAGSRPRAGWVVQLPAGTYTASANGNVMYLRTSADGNTWSDYGTATNGYTFTLDATKYVALYSAKNADPDIVRSNNIQLEQGSTATIYVPYCATDGAIKIATTKYTEDAFAGLITTLESAINKVTNIVDTTVQQATEIGNLATTKQDRPDTDCPAGRKCLLIMGADNKPHWYLIQE